MNECIRGCLYVSGRCTYTQILLRFTHMTRVGFSPMQRISFNHLVARAVLLPIASTLHKCVENKTSGKSFQPHTLSMHQALCLLLTVETFVLRLPQWVAVDLFGRPLAAIVDTYMVPLPQVATYGITD